MTNSSMDAAALWGSRTAALSPELATEARAVLMSHDFIHIPKTGGTSVEDELLANGHPHLAIRWLVRDCCQYGQHHIFRCCHPGPPWHLAPDVFEHTVRQSADLRSSIDGHQSHPGSAETSADALSRRRRWCVVREPAARWASCVAWARRYNPAWGQYAPELVAAFAHGRFSVGWGADDRLAHRQPQHWFVWDEIGQVQCDCVVAIEKLHLLTSRRSNRETTPSSDVPPPLPAALEELYAADRDLWRRALRAPGICYEPRELSPPSPPSPPLKPPSPSPPQPGPPPGSPPSPLPPKTPPPMPILPAPTLPLPALPPAHALPPPTVPARSPSSAAILPAAALIGLLLVGLILTACAVRRATAAPRVELRVSEASSAATTGVGGAVTRRAKKAAAGRYDQLVTPCEVADEGEKASRGASRPQASMASHAADLGWD